MTKLKETEIEMTVCLDIAFMLIYGYSDTLSSEEQQEFHDYMDRLRERIPYDFIIAGEMDDEPFNWTRCEVLGLLCDAWEVPVKLIEVTLNKTICGNTLLCPVLGQTYNYFDDGKIKPSRRMEVLITEIIPFAEVDEETLNDWKEEVEECDWLYAKETDYFVKADLKVSDDKTEKIIFVRTINNNDGWFSLGWWGGRLDIDGSLNALLNGA